ncbi:hypothetical protein, partial [Streptococcus loxodontisalivarius]
MKAFLTLGIFESETVQWTVSGLSLETRKRRGSNGIPLIPEIIHWIISPDVRHHLRKVSKKDFIFNQRGWAKTSFRIEKNEHFRSRRCSFSNVMVYNY